MNTLAATFRVSIILFAASLLGGGCFTPQQAPRGQEQSAPGTTTATATPTSTPASGQATTSKPAVPGTKPKATAPAKAPAVKTVAVTITGGTFSPQVIAVNAGDTVVWVNKDSVSHTSKSNAALIWDSGNIAPGKSYSRIFKAAGSYPYSCAVHPSMQGTVVVH